jgi:hypothetical protein
MERMLFALILMGSLNLNAQCKLDTDETDPITKTRIRLTEGTMAYGDHGSLAVGFGKQDSTLFIWVRFSFSGVKIYSVDSGDELIVLLENDEQLKFRASGDYRSTFTSGGGTMSVCYAVEIEDLAELAKQNWKLVRVKAGSRSMDFDFLPRRQQKLRTNMVCAMGMD